MVTPSVRQNMQAQAKRARNYQAKIMSFMIPCWSSNPCDGAWPDCFMCARETGGRLAVAGWELV